MEKAISFKNQKGTILRGFVNIPKKYDTALIFCHGFPSSAIGTSGTRIGKTFEKLKYLTLRFSFSGTPPSDGKFQDKLMSQESREIKYAIDFLTQNYAFKKLILFGHSTGAIDLALYAYKDKRITKVILGGAVANLKKAVHYDFTDEQISSFNEKGQVIYNHPDKWFHNKHLNKTFYDEFFKLDIPKAVKKYHRPLLIIYGEKDVLFDQEAKMLYENANKPKRLVMIKGAEHQFKKPAEWKQVVNAMRKFIEYDKV